MNANSFRAASAIWLNQVPFLLLVVVFLGFSLQSSAFWQPANVLNILLQTSSTGILAVGMTFVLLTAGVDLSVGSIMFVAAAIGGKLALAGYSLPAVLAVMIGIGIIYGCLNAVFITKFAIMAFVVTLATRYLGRGLGLRITETRAMNLPDSFYDLGATKVLTLPLPVLIFCLVVLMAHLTLTRTPFGRQIYAIGADAEAAKKAGIKTSLILFLVYVLCAVCAAVSGIVALSQAPAVSPSFGNNREFMAIAAAVLGGTSLFGGRGNVFPGTMLGAVLIQTIENGLNILNVNPYLYPLIISSIIFLTVLLDAMRHEILARTNRRRIYAETSA